jgi:hypothetical protein
LYFYTYINLIIVIDTEFLGMQLFNTQRVSLFIFLPLCLVGCASDPVPAPQPQAIISGDTMLRESEGIASLGERWKSGKQLVDRGNEMVKDGENKIDEGNRLISEGNKIIRESEQQYKGIKK